MKDKERARARCQRQRAFDSAMLAVAMPFRCARRAPLFAAAAAAATPLIMPPRRYKDGAAPYAYVYVALCFSATALLTFTDIAI